MKQPCSECPFKKTLWKGYLGESSYDPETFLASIEASPIPCHSVVDWENDEQEVIEDKCWSNPCTGSLQYMKNQGKIPRDREYAKLLNTVDKNPNVFNWRHEFIKHHGQEEDK